MKKSKTIFISYRRADSAMAAGRLFDDLCNDFGRRSLFRDIHSIGPGQSFRDVLSEALDSTTILLILIGPHWDISRLHEKDDSVIMEIETATRRRIKIIPILVEGGQMPKRDVLPHSISSLVEFQWFKITEDSWDQDVEKLAECIEREGFKRHKRSPRKSPLIQLLMFFIAISMSFVPVLLLNEKSGLIAQGQQLVTHSLDGSIPWWIGRICQMAQGHLVDLIKFQYAMYGALVVYYFFAMVGKLLNWWFLLQIFGMWVITYGIARVSIESWRQDPDVMFRLGAAVGCLYGLAQFIRKMRGKMES